MQWIYTQISPSKFSYICNSSAQYESLNRWCYKHFFRSLWKKIPSTMSLGLHDTSCNILQALGLRRLPSHVLERVKFLKSRDGAPSCSLMNTKHNVVVDRNSPFGRFHDHKKQVIPNKLPGRGMETWERSLSDLISRLVRKILCVYCTCNMITMHLYIILYIRSTT